MAAELGAFAAVVALWGALFAAMSSPPAPGIHVAEEDRVAAELALSKAEGRLGMEWRGRTLIVEVIPGRVADRRIGGRKVQRVRVDQTGLVWEMGKAVLLSHGVYGHRRQREMLRARGFER